jgi:hypothetical protein
MQQIEAICEVLDVEPPNLERPVDPIRSADARTALEQFRRETNPASTHFQQKDRTSVFHLSSTRLDQQQQESRILDSPNLRVDGMFVPQ